MSTPDSHNRARYRVSAVLLLAALLVVPAGAQARCGDCNGDGAVSIIDSLFAAQHGVGVRTLVSPAFGLCNVQGTPGDSGAPGAAVAILDALVIAQAAAGLGVSVGCETLTGGRITGPTGTSVSGAVPVIFDLFDPQGGPLTVSFAYSTGGAFLTPTIAGGSPVAMNPAVFAGPGTGFDFRWNTTADLPAMVVAVTFRIIVSDGANMVSATTGFTVNNSAIDLAATALTPMSAMASAGGMLSVSRTLRNFGTASSGAFQEGYYLSTDALLDAGDPRVVMFLNGGLAGGAVETLSRVLPIPAGMAPGPYFVLVRADDAMTVAESIEANNVAASAGTVTVMGAGCALTVTGTSPAQGPAEGGNEVFIAGTGFDPAQAILIGGDAATDVMVLDGGVAGCGTLISCRVPAASAIEDGTSVAVSVGGTVLAGGYRYFADSVGPARLGYCPQPFSDPMATTQRLAFGFDARIDPATVQNPTPSAAQSTALADALFISGIAHTSEDAHWVVLRRASGTWPGAPFSGIVFADTVGSSAIADLYGNGIVTTGTPFMGRRNDALFSVGSPTLVVDSTAPTVRRSNPAAGAVGVRRGIALEVEFSEAIDPTTLRRSAGGPVTAATFAVRLTAGAVAVPGHLEFGTNCRSVLFVPDAPLPAGAAHQIVIMNGGATSRIEDLAGNGMLATTIDFTTASTTGLAVVACAPNDGELQGGNSVRVLGEGFAPGATVTIDGRACTDVVRGSSSLLDAIVPTGASMGAKDVVVTNVDGLSATGVGIYTYVATRPGDLLQPEVLVEHPVANSMGSTPLAANSKVVVVFSEPMLASAESLVVGSSESIFLDGGAGTATLLSSNPRILVLTRTLPFSTADPDIALWQRNGMDPTRGVRDLAGNRLNSFYPRSMFSAFSSGPAVVLTYTLGAADVVAPSFTARSPAPSSASQESLAPIVITLSERLDPESVESSFAVTDGSGAVAGTLDFNLVTMASWTFTPGRPYSGTVTVDARTVRDLAGNAIGGAVYTFTATGDTQPPVIGNLTVNDIPDYINGDVASGGGSAIGGRLRLPPSGFTIDVEFTDPGGRIDTDSASFSLTSSTAVAGLAPGTNLAPLFPAGSFEITGAAAHFLVPPGLAFPAGVDAGSAVASTVTARVRDLAGNQSAPVTYTFDCVEALGIYAALDGSPDVWNLEFFTNFESTTFSFATYSVTAAGADGCPAPDVQIDFDEDLQGYGINSEAPFSPSGTGVVSGGGLTINAAARNWVINRISYHLYRLFGMSVEWDDGSLNPGFGAIRDFDPSGSRDAANIRFRHVATSSGPGSNRMAFGGYSMVGVLGRASYDSQNRARDHDNGETCSTTNLGVFTTRLIEQEYDGSPSGAGSIFRHVFDDITPFTGAVTPRPVGNSAEDAFVCAPTADPSSFVGARRDRYERVLAALDGFAKIQASVAAHEIGHSLGLVEDGDPGVGLYGGDVAAFPGSGTTTHHVDVTSFYLGSGQELMRSSLMLGSALSRVTGFNGLIQGYLHNRNLVVQ